MLACGTASAEQQSVEATFTGTGQNWPAATTEAKGCQQAMENARNNARKQCKQEHNGQITKSRHESCSCTSEYKNSYSCDAKSIVVCSYSTAAPETSVINKLRGKLREETSMDEAVEAIYEDSEVDESASCEEGQAIITTTLSTKNGGYGPEPTKEQACKWATTRARSILISKCDKMDVRKGKYGELAGEVKASCSSYEKVESWNQWRAKAEASVSCQYVGEIEDAIENDEDGTNSYKLCGANPCATDPKSRACAVKKGITTGTATGTRG